MNEGSRQAMEWFLILPLLFVGSLVGAPIHMPPWEKTVFCQERTFQKTLPLSAEVRAEAVVNFGDDEYRLIEGALYKVDAQAHQLNFIEQLYDKNFPKQNYTAINGVVYRRDPRSKKQYVTRRYIRDGFEDAETICDLIGQHRGWTTFTVQSPQLPTVREYVSLAKHILHGRGNFLDNRIEPSSAVAHSGSKALRAYAVPPSSEMVCTKASLSSELLYFVKGDDFWFAAWYYLSEGGRPFALMDLECTFIKHYPGMRVILSQKGYLGLELKWGAKPKYRQFRGKEIPFPRSKWVRLKLHIHLSAGKDGHVQLWQDDTKIVDAHGQTLPIANAIYDSLEVGITAHSFGPRPAALYIDDIVLSDSPIHGGGSSHENKSAR